MTTVNEIIKDALFDIGANAVGETPDDDTMQHALRVMRKMLNEWSAEGLMVYYTTTENFSLTGATSYTIGSGGTFNTARPSKITGAYTRASNIDTPLDIIDEAKWREISLKSIVAPAAWLWYSPEHPLGIIYLYPLSSDTLYLHSMKPLTDYTALTTTIQLPPGYESAIQYGLAVRLSPSYGKQPSILLAGLAEGAKANIKSLNASLKIPTVKPEILRLTRRYRINEG